MFAFFLVASVLLSGAAAHDQLETARLTQDAQRADFGVLGNTSAFKFSFADPVWLNRAF